MPFKITQYPAKTGFNDGDLYDVSSFDGVSTYTSEKMTLLQLKTYLNSSLTNNLGSSDQSIPGIAGPGGIRTIDANTDGSLFIINGSAFNIQSWSNFSVTNVGSLTFATTGIFNATGDNLVQFSSGTNTVFTFNTDETTGKLFFVDGIAANNIANIGKAFSIKDATGEVEFIDLDIIYEKTSNKGIANGYAGLDGGGKVPSSQLPSFVDDVLEFADFASFPVSGETGKIYIALDTNKTFRWSGSVYVEISTSGASSVGAVDIVQTSDGAGLFKDGGFKFEKLGTIDAISFRSNSYGADTYALRASATITQMNAISSLSWQLNGVDKMAMDSSGNVGIGIAAGSSGSKFYANGNAVTNGDHFIASRIANINFTAPAVLNTNFALRQDGTGKTTLNGIAGTRLEFAQGSVLKGFWDSAGNLVVGDGADPVADKLHVIGSVNTTTGYKVGGVTGFTGTDAYTNFTIVGGIITNATV